MLFHFITAFCLSQQKNSILLHKRLDVSPFFFIKIRHQDYEYLFKRVTIALMIASWSTSELLHFTFSKKLQTSILTKNTPLDLDKWRNPIKRTKHQNTVMKINCKFFKWFILSCYYNFQPFPREPRCKKGQKVAI